MMSNKKFVLIISICILSVMMISGASFASTETKWDVNTKLNSENVTYFLDLVNNSTFAVQKCV